MSNHGELEQNNETQQQQDNTILPGKKTESKVDS